MAVFRTLFLAIAVLAANPGIAKASGCRALAAMKRDHFWTQNDQWKCELCLFNRVAIGPGRRLAWNGRSITPATLRAYLRQSWKMEPRPITLLTVGAAADCGAVEAAADIVARETPCRGKTCWFALVRRPIRR
jgi:hypothetical protein